MKRIVLAVVLAIGLLTPVVSQTSVYASAFSGSNAKGQACSGISGEERAGACTTSGKSVDQIIASIVNFLSALIGVVAVIMIMVAGYKYMTATGDASKIAAAKSTLIYAIVGLVIVGLAQFITQFVIEQAI